MTRGTKHQDYFQWTAEISEELARLWLEGLPASEIGRRIGVSKNSAIGRAHRLGLPGRVSPIGNYSPPLANQNVIAARKLKQQREAVKKIVVTHAFVLPENPKIPVRSQHTTCQYIFGDVKTPGWGFCQQPALSSGPYCYSHHCAVYVRPSRMAAE